ncbi:imidazoleglycerol-phosphate dehydratase HisB [Hippea maritima]|uniref:Imidazoleglycerol-phosphate dehydratase n=1 Tax=Hippea maritima (strain ATCC 700847 / DSM 10411 / MH2) TaxID=760142 RepID=F2LX94_HIPMA|nr:imidazoleglycerol-phosphate dehydratase HisB [Hippea maritima]AEA33152.1 Imidazoleglycerol-phosphate dehydratase [Hippea maritima DSM 10411]
MIELKRKTKETDIVVRVDIDGKGDFNIDTGIGFFDHMLSALSKHSGIDLMVKAKGDLEVDFHHTVEDVGIVLGQAVKQSLEGRSFARFGWAIVPMDDALILSSVDICNRFYLNFDARLTGNIGSFDSELIEEFFRAFAFNGGMVLHIKQLSGANKHHIAEAIFKSTAHSLKAALKSTDETPSTKGIL